MSGVYPVYETDFLISDQGVVPHVNALAAMVIIKDMESWSCSVDGEIVEWSPMDMKGWLRRLMTGKAISVAVNGKRHFGDPGNDYIASKALTIGQSSNTTGGIRFPNGDSLIFDCVVDVTDPFGGDSRDADPLSFSLLSDGKPTYVFADEAPVYRTFTVAASGTPTNKLTFDFDDAVATLPVEDIVIASGSSSAVKGALAKGTGNKWDLTITSGGSGSIFVTIQPSADYRFPASATKVNLVGS